MRNALNPLHAFPAGYLGYDALGRMDRVVLDNGGGVLFDHVGGEILSEYHRNVVCCRIVIRAISNAAGTSIATNRYDEYGIPASTNVGRFQYTGQAWIAELGMQYSKARIYSPTLGRFMQTDPIGYADGPNLYNYVGGDPVNMVDPWGTDSAPIPTDPTVIEGRDIVVPGYKPRQSGDFAQAPGNGGGSGNPVTFVKDVAKVAKKIFCGIFGCKKKKKSQPVAEPQNKAQAEQNNCASSGINKLVAGNPAAARAIAKIDRLGAANRREYGFVARGGGANLDIGPITTGTGGLWNAPKGFTIRNFVRLNGNAVVFHSHHPADIYDADLSGADIANGDGWGEAMSVSVQNNVLYCSRTNR